MCLTLGQLEPDRTAFGIDKSMDLGAQATARVTHTMGSFIFVCGLSCPRSNALAQSGHLGRLVTPVSRLRFDSRNPSKQKLHPQTDHAIARCDLSSKVRADPL
jgi:hypothetical protein